MKVWCDISSRSTDLMGELEEKGYCVTQIITGSTLIVEECAGAPYTERDLYNI